MNRIRKRRFLTALIILITFLTLGKFYQLKQIDNVKEVLQENAVFASEPLWNFDIEAMEDYFKVVSDKNNYSHLQIFDNQLDEKGELVLELTSTERQVRNKTFFDIDLFPEIQFEHNIVYDGEVIGRITVSWADNSIYLYVYTFLIALLLYIIVQLYLGMLDAKASLEEQFYEVKKQKDYIEKLFNIVPEGLITFDEHNNEIGVNNSFDSIVKEWSEKRQLPFSEAKAEFVGELVQQSSKEMKGQYTLSQDNQSVVIEYTKTDFESSDNDSKLISIRDITRLTSLERQLSQAQKLEAVGRLASGIAHEINTPTQYVVSNIDFMGEAIEDIVDILEPVKKFTEIDLTGEAKDIQTEVVECLNTADWEFLKDEIPEAIHQAKEGMQRISKIVLAMKNFSHPSGDILEQQDINKAIETTVSIARNEWKYVAEVNLVLDHTLPKVACYLDELNQVFLIMIVNSAHAIIDRYGSAEPVEGVITISTEMKKGDLVITFHDNGNGISQEDKTKIFDPFFTTKGVDKGTGQGLTIAHDIVVKKHKGKIQVESEVGKGTAFTLTIPSKID